MVQAWNEEFDRSKLTFTELMASLGSQGANKPSRSGGGGGSGSGSSKKNR
jgi:hypothetical protein